MTIDGYLAAGSKVHLNSMPIVEKLFSSNLIINF